MDIEWKGLTSLCHVEKQFDGCLFEELNSNFRASVDVILRLRGMNLGSDRVLPIRTEITCCERGQMVRSRECHENENLVDPSQKNNSFQRVPRIQRRRRSSSQRPPHPNSVIVAWKSSQRTETKLLEQGL